MKEKTFFYVCVCVFCLLKVIIIPDVPGEKNGIWKECKKLNEIGPITESRLLNCDIIGNKSSKEHQPSKR